MFIFSPMLCISTPCAMFGHTSSECLYTMRSHSLTEGGKGAIYQLGKQGFKRLKAHLSSLNCNLPSHLGR